MIPTVVAAYLEHTPQVFLWVVLIYSSASLFGVLVLMGVQASLLKSQRRDEFELRTKPTVTPNVYMVNNHETQPATDDNQNELKQRVSQNQNGIKNKY